MKPDDSPPDDMNNDEDEFPFDGGDSTIDSGSGDGDGDDDDNDSGLDDDAGP
jgi:hypothetical protein